MEYCVQAWNPYYRKDTDILEKIQRHATKMVPELRHLSYIDRLMRLNLTSLEDRRQRGDLIEAYKIISGKDNVKCDKFFKRADSDLSSITRGNSQKLYKPRLNKGILQRSNFFSIRVVNSWNKLPEEVISAETVNSFKNRLDKHNSEDMGHKRHCLIYSPHRPKVK